MSAPVARPVAAAAAAPARADSALQPVSYAQADPPRPAMPSAEKPTAPRFASSHVEEIGRKLAAGSPDANLEFQFGVLANPVARACHSCSGQVFVSTGLLLGAASAEDIACALAWEMGEAIAERDLDDSLPDEPPAKAPAANEAQRFAAQANRKPDRAAAESHARRILQAGGYGHVDLAAWERRRGNPCEIPPKKLAAPAPPSDQPSATR